MHPDTEAILRYFEYSHLGEELQTASRPFYSLAHGLAENEKLEEPELTVCLRKLLEAKDCAVRAAL